MYFPLRLGFDSDDGRFEALHHPKSHLTLGQFQHCRIPVSGPLTPVQFLGFILRNFYNTAHQRYTTAMPEGHGVFPETIAGLEREVVHVRVGA